jgi:hypothetical protein
MGPIQCFEFTFDESRVSGYSCQFRRISTSSHDQTLRPYASASTVVAELISRVRHPEETVRAAERRLEACHVINPFETPVW